MNLNSAGGQNIVQPGRSNYLGMLSGVQGRNRDVKNKFALQKLVMDYGHQQRIERDELAHKHKDTENKNKEIYKVAAPLAGAGINFEQNSEHYGLAAARASGAKEGTPEFEQAKLAGAKTHWEHARLTGLDKGSLGNGLIGANLQKDIFNTNKGTDDSDVDVISGPDNKNPGSRTPNQFDDVTPAESGARGSTPPKQPGMSREDWDTFSGSRNAEKFPGTGFTNADAARGEIHSRAGWGTDTYGKGRPWGVPGFLGTSGPAARRDWNNSWNNEFSPFSPKNKTPAGEGIKPARYDVANAHISGLITDEEANDLAGDNSFGSGTGNHGMSAEQVHRRAGLNTFGDSTRINEFGAGQEKE